MSSSRNDATNLPASSLGAILDAASNPSSHSSQATTPAARSSTRTANHTSLSPAPDLNQLLTATASSGRGAGNGQGQRTLAGSDPDAEDTLYSGPHRRPRRWEGQAPLARRQRLARQGLSIDNIIVEPTAGDEGSRRSTRSTADHTSLSRATGLDQLLTATEQVEDQQQPRGRPRDCQPNQGTSRHSTSSHGSHSQSLEKASAYPSRNSRGRSMPPTTIAPNDEHANHFKFCHAVHKKEISKELLEQKMIEYIEECYIVPTKSIRLATWPIV